MFNQMTAFLLVLLALLGTTMSAIIIGDNQRIDGNVRARPYEDVYITGRPNYNGQPNIRRYPTNNYRPAGNGITIGNGNTIRGGFRSDLPPGANLNGLLSGLPGGNRVSYNNNGGSYQQQQPPRSYMSYQTPNAYNSGSGYQQPPRSYNSYPSNGNGGIVIGNGVTHRGGISASLY